MSEPTTDYLQDFERVPNLLPADKGLRFTNFLIDSIIFAFLNYFITRVYESFVLDQFAIDNESALLFTFFGLLISIVADVLFYTTLEYYTKGRTIGKLVSNTIAVRKDGKLLTFKDALLRSLCRLIPFEAIAALFVEPWHDSITNTTVVRKTWD
jgi:uncharacterized RDD family membrane protein YckC